MYTLIVDDEQAILEQAKIFLKQEDERIDVETTVSGKKALQKIRKGNYDAVISDYLLPDLDGVEILRKLRKDGNDIFFIILTGRDAEEAEDICLQSGADNFFMKTGSPKKLYQKIARAITEETG